MAEYYTVFGTKTCEALHLKSAECIYNLLIDL